ncbi:MAG TPA: V-type ATP synthase subunit D [Phycisphaerae bacterium]|nr:V-type ATP synthase subunit D [Phycisphaerae bacterium]HUT61829.1 V-type ATP synthase subunit D [Phycisphaerae bacterium]
MAKKIKLTRPELKRQRDALARFERYLPMLKLKQQQLQLAVREVDSQLAKALGELRAARDKFGSYRAVLRDRAGVDVEGLARPEEVKTATANIAGVRVPVLEAVRFGKATYSLFGTPPWVDRALADLREVNEKEARADVLRQHVKLLRRELTKIIQRVNLFEKVKIPDAREAIRVIRIALGDEMTAAVGRAKIAKAKIGEAASGDGGPAEAPADEEAGP